MGRKIIYLVRHGDYESSLPVAAQSGRTDQLEGSLTDLGREQAHLVAQRLRQIPIDRIHYSPMRRAAETAEIIATAFPGVPLHASELLWEIRWRIWKILADGTNPVEGEILEQVEQTKQRIAAAFDRYFIPGNAETDQTETDQQEILVCHGNIIRYFIQRALQIPAETLLTIESANCGISTLIVGATGQLTLVNYNDVGHLPIAKQTYIRYVPVFSPTLELSSSS